MARVIHLLAAERRNAARAARIDGPFRGADQGTLLVITTLLALALTALAAWSLLLLRGHDVASPVREYLGGLPVEQFGLRLFEQELMLLSGAWLVLPVLANGLHGGRRRVRIAQLLRFPLGFWRLFVFGLSAQLGRWAYVILGLATVAGLAPVAALPNPLAGAAAGALFLVGVATLALGIGWGLDAILTAGRGREIALLLVSVGFCATLAAFLVPLERTGNGFELLTPFDPVLLVSRDGTRGVFPFIADWAPGSWVAEAAVTGFRPAPFAKLAALAAGSLALTGLAFRRALLAPPPLSRGRPARLLWALSQQPWLRDPLRAATEKENLHLLRTLDALVGFALGVIGAVIVFASSTDPLFIAAVVIAFNVNTQLAIPCNAFGLDRGGVDRYRLAPLTTRAVLLSKNFAWWWQLTFQMSPLLVAVAIDGSVRSAGVAALGQATLGVASSAWGNLASVDSPRPREFWNFDSKEQAGGITSQVFMALFTIALFTIGAVAFMIDKLLETWWASPLAGAVVLLVAFAAWLGTLNLAVRRFDARAEAIRTQLSR